MAQEIKLIGQVGDFDYTDVCEILGKNSTRDQLKMQAFLEKFDIIAESDLDDFLNKY